MLLLLLLLEEEEEEEEGGGRRCHVAAAASAMAEVDPVDYEDDDLLGQDMPVDDADGDGEGDVAPMEAAAAPAAAPKLRSTITGAAAAAAAAASSKKTKGRGFKDAMEVDRGERFGTDFESLGTDGGPGPQRCIQSPVCFCRSVCHLSTSATWHALGGSCIWGSIEVRGYD